MKMKFFLAGLLAASSLFALEPNDENQIHQIIENYTDSWNNRGGVGFGDGFSSDADFVNIFGMKFTGRAEIEKRHIDIIQGIFKDSVFTVEKTHFREVQPGLVVANVYWALDGFRFPNSEHKEVREGVFTHIFILNNGKWEITASQNTMMPKIDGTHHFK